MELLKRHDVNLEGAEAVVVGRSDLVGKPISALLLQANATVTTAHSRTRDLAEVCRRADVLVAAVGVAHLIKGDWVKEGAVVIDVGMNRLDGKLTGDVEFDSGARARRPDHARARRRRPDDDRDADAQHARSGESGLMRKAEPLAGLGGLALFVSLFLSWYNARPIVRDEFRDAGFQAIEALSVRVLDGQPDNAWGYFAVIDILLAILAALALAVPLVSLLTKGPAKADRHRGAGQRVRLDRDPARRVPAALPALRDVEGVQIVLGTGGWVALAGAIVAWVGSWLSMRDESTPGASVPDVPRLPVP